MGQKTGEDGRSIFERVAEESRTYKTKALMSLAATEARRGNYGDGFRYFTEALKTTDNPSLIVDVSRSIAVVKATEGFHPQSLKDLERIAPLLRYANPHARCQYYNSCAVELAEVGRLEEARNISNIVLASPYINAYPEWRETREDIERKGYSSRSFVAGTQGATPQNIVRLPERENVSVSQGEPARILHFDWKSMVKEPNDTDDKLPHNATEKDIFLRIVQIATRDGITEKTLWKMLAAVEKIAQERDKD